MTRLLCPGNVTNLMDQPTKNLSLTQYIFHKFALNMLIQSREIKRNFAVSSKIYHGTHTSTCAHFKLGCRLVCRTGVIYLFICLFINFCVIQASGAKRE